jgi:hypothetical protein
MRDACVCACLSLSVPASLSLCLPLSLCACLQIFRRISEKVRYSGEYLKRFSDIQENI